MARKVSTHNAKTKPAEVQDQPQEISKPASGRRASRGATSKADAVRAALAEGIEAPAEALGFIRRRFGIEMGKPMFSSYKAKLRKKEGGTRRRARRTKAIEGYLAPPPPQPADGGADLLDSLETLKP